MTITHCQLCSVLILMQCSVHNVDLHSVELYFIECPSSHIVNNHGWLTFTLLMSVLATLTVCWSQHFFFPSTQCLLSHVDPSPALVFMLSTVTKYWPSGSVNSQCWCLLCYFITLFTVRHCWPSLNAELNSINNPRVIPSHQWSQCWTQCVPWVLTITQHWLKMLALIHSGDLQCSFTQSFLLMLISLCWLRGGDHTVLVTPLITLP